MTPMQELIALVDRAASRLTGQRCRECGKAHTNEGAFCSSICRMRNEERHADEERLVRDERQVSGTCTCGRCGGAK